MSLFEKIKNKRTSLQEVTKKDDKPLKDRVNKGSGSRTTRIGGNDPIKQKAEAEYVKYTDDLARKRGITGKNPGKKLEKQVDTGLKKQDGTIGKRTPNKGYAQGEPFQGNTNVKDKTGRYPASGKSTLQGRQRYQFDIAKTSRKDAAKARLVTRIQKVEDPFFADKGGRQDVKKITKYVDDITKNQTLSKGKGTKSSLLKTLKSYTDAKNPTVQGGGKPARFVKGKDGVVRQYGGGRIPDKSSGAYGSANDRVAVSADGKTRIKHPEYEKMKKDARKIKKKYTKINTNTGTGGGFGSSSGKKILTKTAYNPYKATSRFGRMMSALKKNPKTAAAALAIGAGVYLYNKGKNSPKGIVPPVAGGGKKIKSAKSVDINFTLGGSGYGSKAGRTSKGAN